MGRSSRCVEVLDHVWPAVTPEQLVFELLADPARWPGGRRLLSRDEQAALRWAKPPEAAKSARWTAADAVLIDEAAGLIDRLPCFGHVVRRRGAGPVADAVPGASPGAASTARSPLLGDLAQGTAPWAARDWRDAARPPGQAGRAGWCR